MMRNLCDLHAAILAAAKDGRGLRLSPPEVEVLAKQPFVAIDPRVLALEWRPIPGFERYEVSEHGHVRRGLKLLKLTERKSLHLAVTVYDKDGKQWRTGVHQLVALAFLGPPAEGKSLACHKNGRAWENIPSNLYWGSHADNGADVRHHNRHGRGKSVE